KPGKLELAIIASGVRARAVYRVTTGRDKTQEGGGGETPPAALLHDVRLELSDGRARVTGMTDLANGFFVVVSLGYVADAEVVIASKKVDVAAASFAVDFGPF